MNRRHIVRAALFAAATPLLSSARAQDPFPSQAIRIIVPFVAGSAPDAFARIVGDKLAPILGKPVLIENKPGATSIIGTELVAHSPADGHTLLVATPSTTILAASRRKLAFDPAKDLVPVSMGIHMSPVLITGANSRIKDIKSLIAIAKAQPGKLVIASGGIGNSQHLAAEMLKQMAGIELLHVPYQGTPAIAPALMNGDVDLSFADASALPLIRSGRIRAIAVGSPQRSKTLPEVPTVAEAGIPGFSYQSWYGLMAPAKTPAATVTALNRAINKALLDADLRAKLADAGMEPAPGTPEAMEAFLAEETKRWSQVIRVAKIQFD